MQKNTKKETSRAVNKNFIISPIELHISDKDLIEGLKSEANTVKLNKLANEFYRRYIQHVYKLLFYSCDQDVIEASHLTQITLVFALEELYIKKCFNIPDESPFDEHGYIIKAWLGQIARYKYLEEKKSKYSPNLIPVFSRDSNQIICPVCGQLLQHNEKNVYCNEGHYETTLHLYRFAEEKETESSELMREQDEPQEQELTSSLNDKLFEAINQLPLREQDIFMTYLNEGCIGTSLHLSKEAMESLCKKYNTNPVNLRQIKLRAYNKIKKYCLKQ